jgi:hypothetical protein
MYAGYPRLAVSPPSLAVDSEQPLSDFTFRTVALHIDLWRLDVMSFQASLECVQIEAAIFGSESIFKHDGQPCLRRNSRGCAPRKPILLSSTAQLKPLPLFARREVFHGASSGNQKLSYMTRRLVL